MTNEENLKLLNENRSLKKFLEKLSYYCNREVCTISFSDPGGQTSIFIRPELFHAGFKERFNTFLDQEIKISDSLFNHSNIEICLSVTGTKING